MSARTIIRFNSVQNRARKANCKVEAITSYETCYAIGPISIRNLKTHLSNNEGNDCKVFTYNTLDEVEAHLNAIEFCIQTMKD